MTTLKLQSLSFWVAVIINLLTLATAFAQDNQNSDPKANLPKIIRKSGGVLQQSAINRVEPVYPRRALAEGISGSVVVEITTDEEGKVIQARAISGHVLLKEAALEAARGWTFVPTKLSGVAIKVIGTITFNFNSGKFDSLDKEIEYCKKKIKEDPKSPRFYLILGKAYIKANRSQDAIDVFNQVISLNPNLGEAHYQLGSAFLVQGKPGEAMAAFKTALEINPEQAMAHHSLGDAYSRLGRENDAQLEFKEALRQDPDNAETHFLLGHSYFTTGKYIEAIAELKQLPPNEPYASNAHVWMGLSYFKLGDKEAAMREQKHLEMINKSAAEYLLKEMKK